MKRSPDANRFLLDNRSQLGAGFPAPRLGREGSEGDSDVIVYAQPITDTCKEVVNGMVLRTVPRDDLVDAHGPWIFSRDALAAAVDAAPEEARIDSIVELCRRAGQRIRVRLS